MPGTSKMTMNFPGNANLSIGIEVELQIIDLNNWDLNSDAHKLLEMIKLNDKSLHLKPESTQSTIEINSGIHTHNKDLLQELENINRQLNDYAEKSNMNIGFCGGGTHPFQFWSDRVVSPEKRYQKLEKLYGYLIKHATTFGQHIHVGCKSGDEAIYFCHAFSYFVPQFIALSASSPFYQSIDTEFDSSRLHFSDPLPTSGTIPFFKNWAEFETYFEKMKAMEIVSTMKDIHWDIRPKPEFGTVEIRIFDCPLEINMMAALAAFVQTLALFLRNKKTRRLSKDVYIVYQYNRFQAAKLGLMAECLDYRTRKKYKLSQKIIQTLKMLMPYADELGTQEALNYLLERVMLKVNDANRIRTVFNKNNSLEDVVRFQIDCWKNNFKNINH